MYAPMYTPFAVGNSAENYRGARDKMSPRGLVPVLDVKRDKIRSILSLLTDDSEVVFARFR
jgi:hypothetical protein